MGEQKKRKKRKAVHIHVHLDGQVDPQVAQLALRELAALALDHASVPEPEVGQGPALITPMGVDRADVEPMLNARQLRRYAGNGSLTVNAFVSKADFRDQLNQGAHELLGPDSEGGVISITRLVRHMTMEHSHSANTYLRALRGPKSYFLDDYPPFPWTDANMQPLEPPNADEFEGGTMGADFRVRSWDVWAAGLFELEPGEIVGRYAEEIFDLSYLGEDSLDACRLRMSHELSTRAAVRVTARHNGCSRLVLVTVNNRLQQLHDYQCMWRLLDRAELEDAVRLVQGQAGRGVALNDHTHGSNPRRAIAQAGWHAANRGRVA